MSESKTPVSDRVAKLNDLTAMYIQSCTFEELVVEKIMQGSECGIREGKLELENAELKAKLDESKTNHRALAESSIRIHSEQEAKLAEYERQVKEGELIPADVAENYVQELIKSIAKEFGYTHQLCAETLIDDLKDYAVSRQKEGGV